MIKEEKKKYPSELNTKSIACRIPMADYVEIINECVNKNISVNDWLLMKLYSKNANNISGINESEQEQEFPEFTIETQRGLFTFQDEEDIENTINHLIKENELLQRKYLQISSRIDLDDSNDRNRIYLSIIDKINDTEWQSEKDKILFRKDFKDMWKELFD